MEPAIYKIIHYIGIMALFASFGGLMAADHRKSATMTVYVILHGLSLIVILVAGIGMIHKNPDLSYGATAIAKTVIWLLFGAALVVFKRRIIPKFMALLFMLALGGTAAFLALYKPF